jgi:hypothetical protein
MDTVGVLLARWPELKIRIRGHTDSRGGAAYNLELSRRRAAAVHAYLVEHFPELQVGQLTSVGYGETRPRVPNTTWTNQAKNRRVEFKVLVVLRRLLPGPPNGRTCNGEGRFEAIPTQPLVASPDTRVQPQSSHHNPRCSTGGSSGRKSRGAGC